jgi:ABC-type polysaccharide/polyol phosphate transport system ATPase subunit
VKNTVAVEVDAISKMYRLHHERNQYLKSTALRGRRSKYEEFWALEDVSFDILQGSTFGIIGSNGSGKSTLLKCLAGILSPEKGEIKVRGSLAALLELGAGFHPELSGVENIYLNGAILGMTRRDIDKRIDEIVDFSGLEKFIDTPVKNYSSGMVVRLGFSIASSVDPEILLIDEVLAVGDEAFQRKCGERIEDFRREGRTIVLVSHGLSQIQQLCTTTAWIEKGHLKLIGDTNDILAEYLGNSHDATPREEGQAGQRWGTGEVLISKVEVLDHNGVETGTLTTSSPATFRIHYSNPTAIKEAIVGVRITDIHGVNVWGSNLKRAGVGPVELTENGEIRLRINDFVLLDGTYDLTVAISDLSETHEYDHWDRRIRFDVRQGRIRDEGLVYIKGLWEV